MKLLVNFMMFMLNTYAIMLSIYETWVWCLVPSFIVLLFLVLYTVTDEDKDNSKSKRAKR